MEKSKNPAIMWVINSGLRNGANNVVQTFAENVPKMLNFDQTFLCFDQEGPAVEEMRVITGKKGYHVSIHDIVNNPQKVEELIKNANPAFIHLNTESASKLSPIIKKLGIPHVLEFHGGNKLDKLLGMVEKYFGGEKTTYKELSKQFQSPDALISPAKVVFDDTHYGKLIGYSDKVVIYNGIKDLQPISDSLPSKDEIRKKWGYKTEDNIILVPGNVEPRKGQDLAVFEFNCLLKENKIPKDTKMLIVGYRTKGFDSPLENEFINEVRDYIKQNNLENNIKMIPAQPNLWEFYKMSDSALLPTRSELIPLTVVEARYFKLPVIVSSLVGTPEQIDSFKDGILTNTPPYEGSYDKERWFKPEYEKTPGTVPLKEALEIVINDNGDLKKKFYENGHKRDIVQFSIQTMCKDYAKLVTRIIERKNRQKTRLNDNRPIISRSATKITGEILETKKQSRIDRAMTM